MEAGLAPGPKRAFAGAGSCDLSAQGPGDPQDRLHRPSSEPAPPPAHSEVSGVLPGRAPGTSRRDHRVPTTCSSAPTRPPSCQAGNWEAACISLSPGFSGQVIRTSVSNLPLFSSPLVPYFCPPSFLDFCNTSPFIPCTVPQSLRDLCSKHKSERGVHLRTTLDRDDKVCHDLSSPPRNSPSPLHPDSLQFRAVCAVLMVSLPYAQIIPW